ncbi:hypothetical protein HYS97_03205 [Candidatus Daviesbacteria bacterium]|nr:hypothetical protein [Candidatus Daviesbacteria bacterium]
MIAFGHTAIGSVIGIIGYDYFGQNSPLVGITTTTAVSIASHYLTDFIPHGHFIRSQEYKKKIWPILIFDLALGILIFTLFSYYKFGLGLATLYILFGIGGSHLPDIIKGLVHIDFFPKKGFFKIESAFHKAIHWHGTLSISLLDVWQVVVVLLALLFF